MKLLLDNCARLTPELMTATIARAEELRGISFDINTRFNENPGSTMSRKKTKSSSDRDESKTSFPAVEAQGNPIAAAAAATERSNQSK